VKYSVTLDGQAFDVVVDGDRVEVNGVLRAATLTPIPHAPLRQLVLDGGSRTLAMAWDGSQWIVQLAGRVMPVAVEDERTRLLREMTGQESERRTGGVVRAPMPGLVLRVQVDVGQHVEPDTGVLVLEAMKMENEIRAGVSGVVSAVRVAHGDAVEKGATLIELADQA
jgi:pyruvate carboxylase subunit B